MSNGAMTNTFNTPGVNYGENNVYFLKDLQHARSIRNRILECFERASYPNATKEDIDRLLTFVIVGGGPISVEFAGELHSFLKKDISKWYPEFQNRVNVQIIEAGKHILGPFNPSLVAYAEEVISKKGMNLTTGVAVQEVREHEVELKDGTIIPCGIVVWSTGVKPTRFISTLQDEPENFQFSQGRLLIDEQMRLLKPGRTSGTFEPHRNLFALGDCAVSESKPLPTLGGVARLQALYLSKNFNSGTMENPQKPFKYNKVLQMTALGQGDALIDPTIGPLGDKAPVVQGWKGKVLWMSAYWGFQVSLVNKMLIPMYWFKSFVFGRDISRF